MWMYNFIFSRLGMTFEPEILSNGCLRGDLLIRLIGYHAMCHLPAL